MHPNPHFRAKEQGYAAGLAQEVGFGMIFAQTPDGPRVAHTPVVVSNDTTLRFHLARGNALTRHLGTARALVVVNGIDAYVSARWYADPDQVPTWNYCAAEFEGPVSILDRAALLQLLDAIGAQHEARIKHGTPWTMDKLSETRRDRLLQAIVGFEMQIETTRETIKLAQHRPAEDIRLLADGLDREGRSQMADAMRAYTS